MIPVQQLREDVLEERGRFLDWRSGICARRLLFVDESGVERGMRLAYGYARRGERCHERAPFRVGNRTNLLGWMGATCGEVVPFIGSVTASVFERFVEKSLVPALEPGDIVLWDNARFHSRKAEELVEAAGAMVVRLPRYSPEFNAIEMMWSKVKHLIKRACADTAEALRDALRDAVASVATEDAMAWIQHCGYRFQPT